MNKEIKSHSDAESGSISAAKDSIKNQGIMMVSGNTPWTADISTDHSDQRKNQNKSD